MGYAGLNVKKLTGLLELKKVNCVLVDDDQSYDHCVLKISSHKRPGIVAFVEYENQGIEPRAVGMVIRPETFDIAETSYPLNWEKEFKLIGKRANDAEIIARWIMSEFITSNYEGELLACPCCGNQTFTEESSYEICEICFWENDPVQKAHPDWSVGANHVSLNQARKNYVKIGYCDEEAGKRMNQIPNKYFTSK